MTKNQSQRLKQIPKLFRAIRARCLDCSAGSSYEVEHCVIPDCPLYLYRFGREKITVRKTIRKKRRVEEKNVIQQGTSNPITPLEPVSHSGSYVQNKILGVQQ